MPVIINDFEVTVESPGQAGGDTQAGSDSGQNSAAGPALRPIDIEQIVERFRERRRRVSAD
jgi:hypothetical protein